MEKHDDCFIDAFPLWQKLAMRGLFVGFLVVAVYAVFLQSALWGWIYLGIVTLGQLVLILPSLCGHCPYPHKHNDCLLAPPALMRLIMPFRGPRLGKVDKIALVLGAAAMVLMPQYWLFQKPILLIFFWALLLPFLAFFQLYLCKHCRHVGCPANRVQA